MVFSSLIPTHHKRSELKYYISGSKLQFILDDLYKFTTLDSYAQFAGDGYDVSTLYFDNSAMQSYHEKIEGQRKRIKLRFRFYPLFDKFDMINLEIKIKNGEEGDKKRICITEEEFYRVCQYGTSFLADRLTTVDKTCADLLLRMSGYRPFVRVDYQRIPLVANGDGDIRITLDQNLFCSRFNGSLDNYPKIRFIPNHISILEIKTRFYFPYWLIQIIKKYSLSRSAISKYTLGAQKLGINSSLSIY